MSATTRFLLSASILASVTQASSALASPSLDEAFQAQSNAMDKEYQLLQQTRKLTPGKARFLKQSLPDKATRTVNRAFYEELAKEKKESDERSKAWLKMMLGASGPSGARSAPGRAKAPEAGAPREELVLDGSQVPKELGFRGKKPETWREKLSRIVGEIRGHLPGASAPTPTPTPIPQPTASPSPGPSLAIAPAQSPAPGPVAQPSIHASHAPAAEDSAAGEAKVDVIEFKPQAKASPSARKPSRPRR
jgi:hypothetical protein